jgi:hypothetical protein
VLALKPGIEELDLLFELKSTLQQGVNALTSNSLHIEVEEIFEILQRY